MTLRRIIVEVDNAVRRRTSPRQLLFCRASASAARGHLFCILDDSYIGLQWPEGSVVESAGLRIYKYTIGLSEMNGVRSS